MTVFLNELLKKFKSMPQEEIQRKQEMILFQGERVAQLMFWEISGRILQATSKTEITGLRFGLLLNDKKPKFPLQKGRRNP